MRVISGIAKGRKLKTPQGFDIRPTSSIVKESIFNILQFDIEGRRILDLYAGTGQLGVEALSRGAGSVVFVDSSPEAVKLIKENVELCGFLDSCDIIRRDAIDFLERSGTFDIIFVDPPYDAALTESTIKKIIEFDKLNENGIMLCETRADSITPVVSTPYGIHKEYIYGKVKISRFIRKANESQGIGNRE